MEAMGDLEHVARATQHGHRLAPARLRRNAHRQKLRRRAHCVALLGGCQLALPPLKALRDEPSLPRESFQRKPAPAPSLEYTASFDPPTIFRAPSESPGAEPSWRIATTSRRWWPYAYEEGGRRFQNFALHLQALNTPRAYSRYAECPRKRGRLTAIMAPRTVTVNTCPTIPTVIIHFP